MLRSVKPSDQWPQPETEPKTKPDKVPVSTSVTIAEPKGVYLIDPRELTRMTQMKLFAKEHPAYLYFALQIDYPRPEMTIDFPAFCDRWAIPQSVALKSMGQLQHKGLLSAELSKVHIDNTATQLFLDLEGPAHAGSN